MPRDVWNDWVLPYASVNEARSDWRELLFPAVAAMIGDDASNTSDVVYAVNAALWSALTPSPIVFKSSQTPLVYDPMYQIYLHPLGC